MPYGPGKFEGEPASTFLLYLASLDSSQDETAGTVDDIGWHGLFRGPWADATEDTERLAETYSAGYTEQEVEEARQSLASMAGAILWEDDMGFVYSRQYETNERLEADWALIVAADALVEGEV
jgi:hypothetical protein